VLNVYCTAGYPQLNSTIEVMKALQQHGTDIIEIGMPYSDPLADGPVIQHSSSIALANGMTIAKLFEQLKDFRNSPLGEGGISIPVILMGYMNPVLKFGFENLCEAAARVGVDGIILPDLPMYEFETQYQQFFVKNDLKFIFLVTPETSEERIRKIDSLASGFIYGLVTEMSLRDAAEFGVAASALKHTIPGDLNHATLEDVKGLMKGDASGRVQR